MPLLELGRQWPGFRPNAWNGHLTKPGPSDFLSGSYPSDRVAVYKSLLVAGTREERGSTCKEKQRKTTKRKETRSPKKISQCR